MAEISGKKVKIFSLNANKSLANEISSFMNIPLSEISVKRFADGEVSVDINETVRGYDVFIIQPTNNPVNENYMELFITIDALKRASCGEINVVMPYYGYSRQDRKAAPRQPISSKLMADFLEKAGADRILCLDLHATQIQGFFNIPVDNFVAMPIFARYFDKMDIKDLVVVSPDHGGTTRARKLGDALNVPIAIADKRRPKPNQAEILNMIGDVKDKNCVIIDDIVDTAGTLTAVADAIKKLGAKSVYACCSHPLLSGSAVEKIQNSALECLICTNSVELDENAKNCSKIKQLSIAPLFAQGMLNIIEGRPVSSLFEYLKD